MTYLHIIYETLWFHSHPMNASTPLTWRESFVLARELVGLKLR